MLVLYYLVLWSRPNTSPHPTLVHHASFWSQMSHFEWLFASWFWLYYFADHSPASEAISEVANLTARKNQHTPVHGLKEFFCLWQTLTPNYGSKLILDLWKKILLIVLNTYTKLIFNQLLCFMPLKFWIQKCPFNFCSSNYAAQILFHRFDSC